MSALEREYYEFDRFWNPEFTPLGDTDVQRIEEIANLVPADVESILDAGCGNGMFCNHVSRNRPTEQVVGLDRSKAALKYVATRKVQASITELPFEAKSFDCVTSLEVLEHLPLDVFERAKSELSRVAAKYIIVSVPNDQQLGENLTQCPACRSRFDPDLHMRSFHAEIMKTLFSEHGFTCRQVNELGPFTKYRGFQEAMNFWYARGPKAETMASPLCPICGFRNDDYLTANGTPASAPAGTGESGNGFLTPAKRLIKKLWPKVNGSQWLLGLYERQS